MRKPAKEDFAGPEELKKARKLKPVKKEKNQKKAFFDEIDDLEDIDMDYLKDDYNEEDLFDDDDDY